MAEAFGKNESVTGELGFCQRGSGTAAQDHAVSHIRPCGRLYTILVIFSGDCCDCLIILYLDLQFRGFPKEACEDTLRLFGIGVDPTAPARRVETDFREEAYRILHGKGIEGAGGKARVGAVVCVAHVACVGQVAFAIAGAEQFSTRLFFFFKDRDTGSAPGSHDSCHETGRAGTYNDDLFFI